MALKFSKQREAIRKALEGRTDHPTADTIYAEMRKEFPRISLGTVYRNLILLSDLGEIQRLKVGDGVDHFDPNTNEHYHLLCEKCGAVSDIMLHLDLDSLAQEQSDGIIHGHKAYFYGLCKNCAGKAD